VLFKHERRALPRFRQLHALVQVLSLLAAVALFALLVLSFACALPRFRQLHAMVQVLSLLAFLVHKHKC
jgi:hypothetical protein